jgi:RNA polymerase sigma factor (sigma-70 family)
MAVAQSEAGRTTAPGAETIEEIFAALESPLLSYALRLTKDRSTAEDVVQEAFMKLHAEFQQVREPRRWLYRTVHNLALNQQRAAGRIVPMLSGSEAVDGADDPVDPQPLPDEQIARWEGIGLVRLSLETLDARSRELVRLKFTEGMSYKEMSVRTGLTVGHVGYLLHHALKSIADELSRTGGTP